MGPPGSRKTTFGLQFPDVHVLDCDQNLDGPEKWIRKNLPNFNLSYTYDQIRYDDSGKPREIYECYDAVCDILKRFKNDAVYQKRKTIFLDSLSHVNEFIIRHVLKLQNKQSKSLEMEARDWSPFKSHAYILLVARLEETGKTVICSCHETKIYDKPTKDDMMNAPVKEYEPMFQGKVGETLGAFFTDVWRMEVKPAPGGKTEAILQTDKIPKCNILKNSLGMPPEIDVTKGISAIEQYIKGRV